MKKSFRSLRPGFCPKGEGDKIICLAPLLRRHYPDQVPRVRLSPTNFCGAPLALKFWLKDKPHQNKNQHLGVSLKPCEEKMGWPNMM